MLARRDRRVRDLGVCHRLLLARCWELRDSLTVYDAVYVALAEAMRATLLTGDQRFAMATGPQCTIEVFQPGR